MKRWFEDSFGADYIDRYAHRDMQEAQQTFSLFESATQARPPARLLDLGCGNGRHLRLFVEKGYQVTGLDLSRPLLLNAQSAIPPEARNLVRAEMIAPPFASDAFDAVLNLFTTFGYYATDEENWRVAQHMARILKPGGVLFFDYINKKYLQRFFEDFTMRKLEDGTTVEERRWFTEGQKRIEKETRVLSGDVVEQSMFESVRIFDRKELIEQFGKLGLKCRGEWGDYNGAAWTEHSLRLILAFWK